MGRTFPLGDREYTVAAFNGRKAILAGRFMARIARKVPDLIERDAAFVRRYETENALRISRGMALTSWKGNIPDLSPEEWDAIGGTVVIPQTPQDGLRVAHLFTEIFEAAEEDLTRLLALLVVPNGDLAEAAKGNGGDPKQLLSGKADELLDSGTLGELLALALGGFELIREEFDSGDAMGKLRDLLGWKTPETGDPAPSPSPAPESAGEEPREAPIPESEIPSGESPEKKPTSSIDSPTPTDGMTSESSTELPGRSLSPSGSA